MRSGAPRLHKTHVLCVCVGEGGGWGGGGETPGEPYPDSIFCYLTHPPPPTTRKEAEIPLRIDQTRQSLVCNVHINVWWAWSSLPPIWRRLPLSDSAFWCLCSRNERGLKPKVGEPLCDIKVCNKWPFLAWLLPAGGLLGAPLTTETASKNTPCSCCIINSKLEWPSVEHTGPSNPFVLVHRSQPPEYGW